VKVANRADSRHTGGQLEPGTHPQPFSSLVMQVASPQPILTPGTSAHPNTSTGVCPPPTSTTPFARLPESIPAAELVVKEGGQSTRGDETALSHGTNSKPGYFLELFAGAGGLTAAVRRKGLPVQAAVDVLGSGANMDLRVDKVYGELLKGAKSGRIR